MADDGRDYGGADGAGARRDVSRARQTLTTNRGTERDGAAPARGARRETGRVSRTRSRSRMRAATRSAARAGRRYDTRSYRDAAGARLRRFQQQTVLAVAVTGLVLLVSGSSEVPAQGATVGAGADSTLVQDSAGAGTAAGSTVVVPADTLADSGTATREAARSVEEATTTIRSLVRGTYRILPKVGIAIMLLLLAALLSRFVRPVLRRLLASFDRAEAISALVGIAIWLLALGAALSILAGDARALLGSVGLFGLALSWALQAPIESFSGWLLNSFRSYYRVGDRILVGDVFGDVYKIDFLTTMVWEAGGPGKAVQGAQPTGAVITFPNSEVLRNNVTNFTRDFPYVWDEIAVGVSNDSDLPYAMQVIGNVVARVVGTAMHDPATRYAELLRQVGFAYDVAIEPQLYASPTDSWMDVTARYLVPARERRRWASELQVALSVELAKPEHAERITGSYPVRRIVEER